MAATLYVTEPGSSIHRVDERLVIRKTNKPIRDVPMLNIGQVVVIGRGVEVTTEAMLAMVRRNIDLCFFTRSMKFVARVNGEVSNHGPLRFFQARYVDSPARQLALARIFVRSKLLNQRTVLLGEAANDRGQNEIQRLTGEISRMSAALPQARDLDSLRGYEGQGAALYFRGLRMFLPEARIWGFQTRQYNPPPDPINALLSYGYSLLTREVLAKVYLSGLDPYLGFFHVIDHRRPSLALDLVEEFRPVVTDSLVLRLLRPGLITLADFERVSPAPVEDAEEGPTVEGGRARGGFQLKSAARTRFLEAYETRLEERVWYELAGKRFTLRNIIEAQVQQLARLMRGETDQFQPFLLSPPGAGRASNGQE